MRPRIYIDTSVIGGCLDAEFQEPSRELFGMFRRGLAIAVLSDLTLLELIQAPEAVRDVVSSLPDEFREDVAFTEEAADLAERYIASGVNSTGSRVDARHIATATVHHVQVLVSWNFKHIVNLERIHGYNSVNIRHGYPLLEIRTPREVAGV